jgi:hypothetical protein
MHELPLAKATIKKVNGHQYYIFPPPPTHTNYDNRPNPTAFATKLVPYHGKGNNGSAQLHPDVIDPANLFMTALLEYGEYINDWSMRSAVIQNGYRPSDEVQGSEYLRIIKDTIRTNPAIFSSVQFPANLEREAQSVLGCPGDPRLRTFMNHVAQSPGGWTQALADRLFGIVHNAYAPRGCNPHATGYVFDLDFPIFYGGTEVQLGAKVALNGEALRSAAGMWINLYAGYFCFDSYNTAIEIWHMEYRRCGPPSISPGKIPVTA